MSTVTVIHDPPPRPPPPPLPAQEPLRHRAGAPTWAALQVGRYGDKVRMQAFACGVRNLGGRVMALEDSCSPLLARMDLSQVRVSFTSGMHYHESWARGYLRGRGIPLLVLDLGYIRRAGHAQDASGYNQLGVGRLGWIPEGELPPDRLNALNVMVAEPKASSREHVALVLGQTPDDSQHQMTARHLSSYLAERCAWWQARGYRLHFRPHPGAMSLAIPGATFERVRNSNDELLAAALAEARVAVTLNSTAGLEAILQGVPVDCDPGAHYAGVAAYGWGEDLAAKEQWPHVSRLDVLDYLARVGYAQWTVPELQSGAALRFVAQSARLLRLLEAISND